MRALIIARDPLARAGLAALLSLQPGLTIAGQVSPQDNLQQAVSVFLPDVVVWDLGWQSEALVESLSQSTELLPPLLALIASPEVAPGVWASGARGVLLRSTNGEQMAVALAALQQGLIVGDHPPVFAAPPTAPTPPRDEFESLTERELEVLQRVASGLSNKQIAREMSISEHTVKFHVNAILGKMNAQSRTDAVVKATRAGLIFL